MNVANLITMLRFPLLVVVVLLLYFGGSVGQLVDGFLIVVLILMDSLDGFVARRREGTPMPQLVLPEVPPPKAQVATRKALDALLRGKGGRGRGGRGRGDRDRGAPVQVQPLQKRSTTPR